MALDDGQMIEGICPRAELEKTSAQEVEIGQRRNERRRIVCHAVALRAEVLGRYSLGELTTHRA